MPYPQMLYGAALSAVLATILVATLGRCRTPTALLTSALTALAMPLAWNLVLRTTGTTGSFSHDLPFPPFPISWQDTGTGVFTLAGASLVFAGLPGVRTPRRVIGLSLLTAVAALLVDIYTY